MESFLLNSLLTPVLSGMAGKVGERFIDKLIDKMKKKNTSQIVTQKEFDEFKDSIKELQLFIHDQQDKELEYSQIDNVLSLKKKNHLLQTIFIDGIQDSQIISTIADLSGSFSSSSLEIEEAIHISTALEMITLHLLKQRKYSNKKADEISLFHTTFKNYTCKLRELDDKYRIQRKYDQETFNDYSTKMFSTINELIRSLS